MPGTVAVEVIGSEMLAQELVSAGDRSADLMPYWPNVVRRLEDINEEQFATEGARSGAPWMPNSQEWQWFKFQKGLSLDKYKATDAMYEALTGHSPHAIRGYSPDSLSFGADLKQFGIHQSSIHPPMELTEADEVELAEGMMTYILGTLGAMPAFTLDRAGRKRVPKGQPGAGRFA